MNRTRNFVSLRGVVSTEDAMFLGVFSWSQPAATPPRADSLPPFKVFACFSDPQIPERSVETCLRRSCQVQTVQHRSRTPLSILS